MQFCGGMRTEPNGARFQLSLVLGGWRRRLSSAQARLGVWERLLRLVQERGIALGLTFLEGSSIRAHQKASGAARKGDLQKNETIVKHVAGLPPLSGPGLILVHDGSCCYGWRCW